MSNAPLSTRKRVVAMYTDEDQPMTIAEIHRELGIGRETVREHLIRAKVERRAQKARGSRDERMVAEAVDRYKSGQTLWNIADSFGKTATTVRSWLIDAGVERRRPGAAADPDSLQETSPTSRRPCKSRGFRRSGTSRGARSVTMCHPPAAI